MIPSILLTLALTPQSPPQTSFVEKLPDTQISFKMVRLPDGKVTVNGKAFDVKNLYIGETEITWDVFDIYAFSQDLTDDQKAAGVDAKSRPSRPYGRYDRGFGHAGFPAIGMHFQSAEMFCAWLSKKTGKKYRLPNEAEWEYAARAAVQAEPADLDKFAWYKANSDGQTQAVGKKQANAWGLFDMLGNASEWCVSLGDDQVTRGGCYRDAKDVVNFSKRVPYSPDWQERDAQLPKSKWWLSDGGFVGLRVVCEAP
jgi:formylglycine-generating enzyme required for sulfatase activity